jgi:hypothetical protein
VQDPEEAQQRSMPIHVIARDHPDAVVRLAALPALLKSLAKGAQVEPATDLARHTLWP